MKRYNDCMEVREDFSAYLDGELAAEEREPLESHLAVCAECLREMDVLKRVDDSYRKLAPVPAPTNFEAGVRDVVRTGRMPSDSGRQPVPRWMGPLVAMASAAAVLIVGVGVLEWRQGNNGGMQLANAPVTQMESVRFEDSVGASQSASVANSAVAGNRAAEGDAFFAPKREGGDTAWENFAQSAPASPPSATSGGREDSAESLGRSLTAAEASADIEALSDGAAVEGRARADLLGSPPPPSEEAESSGSKVFDAWKDEPSPAGSGSIAQQNAQAQPGDITSRQTLRSFHVLPGPLWVEEGYEHQQATPLKRKSPEMRELMKKYPEADWEKLLERTARQIFQMGNAWYDLEATPQEPSPQEPSTQQP